MAHEIHLKNKKYRQWVKAGLGLGYLKEGLAPFCDDIGRQQHKDIINQIQQTKTPQPNIPCGTCQITALQPDHVRVSKGICPLKQDKCNCCFPNMRPCPNNVCGAIYDSIIQYHASIPPAPFWKNSDAKQWSRDPWSVIKCFIKAPGYKDKTSAVDTDCTGLLHVIINNKYFHSHIGCNVTGPNNLFSKVRQYRNMIFHSSSMELEESETNTYLDDMITVLQDSKVLVHQPAAQQAVLKLQDLKQKDFVITTECSEEILKQIKDEMTKIREFTENAATKVEYEELKNIFIELERQLAQEREEQKRKYTELEAVITEQKQEIKRRKVEDSPQQKKFQYEKAKSEWREKLIEQYHKTMLQVPTSPLQPKSEKCSFNEIYIRPKITREIKQEKGETKEVEVETMSEIFTKDGVPQKSVYVLGDAGSGKTSFCKYLVNCWCLAHSEEHEADNENGNKNKEGNGKPEGDSETHGGDGEKHGAGNANEGGSSKPEGDSEKHGGDDEKYEGVNENEDGNSKPEGDSEKHVGDGEKHGAGYENEDGSGKPEGHGEKHGGDDEKHGAGDENEDGSGKPEGDGEKHGGDNEKHGAAGVNDNEGGTEKQGGDFEEHEKRRSDIVNEEVKGTYSGDIENEESSRTHQGVNEKREDEKHVGGIKENGSDSDDSDCDLIYSKSDSDDYDTDLSEFDSDDSEYDNKNYELKFNGVKEMKKFDFVFYIPLRQYQNIDTIDEMLQKRYQMKMLNTLLQEESSRVMILLDGLDEWSSENVPEHSIFKEYTILTTSRPWKFHTLRSNDVEIDQSLKLKGFDFRCEWEMVNRTVSQLNVNRLANKEARDCRKKLKEKSLKSLKKVPIMLQQLICLWFDGKLDKTSRCAIYAGMLELFFTWNDMKTTGTSTRLMKGTQKGDLPKYLADKTKLKLNRHFIYEISRLAYETLFNCPKDKSLTFDICMFDELEISDEVRENCLKLGIITEDICPSLSVSEPPSSLFSFIHKSMQEFLAAVNIGINFNAKMCSSDSTGNVELAKKFINEVFQKCSTVNDLLEQSNVIIMLCGLEPRSATHVSKYMYDTVSEDSRVQEYRRTIYSDYLFFIDSETRYIADIQKLMFDSIEEFNAACSIGSNPVFYIGDLVIIDSDDCDIVCSGIDQHQIVPDSVLSITVDINTKNVKFTKYLPMFHHLEKIVIRFNSAPIDEINNCVSETIKVNTSTLKSLSLDDVSNTDKYYPVYIKTVVSNLSSMINLVAIRMSFITMSHDDTSTFCNFLERTSHLEQIHLDSVKCECKNQHDVNLSKHQQLQYLCLYDTVSVIDVDTTNLEIFTFDKLKNSNYEKIFDIIRKSYKLKELKLCGEYNNKSQIYHTNITKRLVTVLPLLHNLSRLELWLCRLTDNIIQSPLEMKSLKYIQLREVIMSLTTWQKFVDSLPGIPHTVDVSVWDCYISGDGEEFNDDWLTLRSLRGLTGGKGNDAKQYVKDRDQLFHVKRDDGYCFEFSTKK